MNKLPSQLSGEILANLFHAYTLFCGEVDPQGKLVHMWGNNEFYGLHDWHIGFDLLEVDFLLGLPIDEEWVMRDVNVSPNNHADIYFTPTSRGKRYILFVSTEGSIERRRENQQRGNELTLMVEQNKQLITDLKQAKSTLSSENISKSEFIAGMSHEFRTPLTSIMGYTELISEQRGLTPETQEHLGAIERASQHLLSLVENLLDQSQFESNQFKLQLNNISLEELLNEVSAVMAPLAGAKALSFSASISARCERFAFMDNVRVRQILINLLANAIKFTQEGEVSINLDEEDGHFVFMVCDSGPGIPELEQENIFKPYQRLHDSAKISGAGLGLSITRQLVSRMSGKIELESTLGTGSTFIVKLPIRAAEEDYIYQKTQQMTVTELQMAKEIKTILLAEDNPDISNLLKILLQRSGFEVTIAENGHLALAYSRARVYDLVITDLHMPILDGRALVQFLRNEGYTNPIIALTASHKKNEREELFAAGFSEFLTKPIQMPDLLATLDRLAHESDSNSAVSSQ